VDKECHDKGRTALSYAAHYGSLDCLQVLGIAGADPFHEDFEGFSVQVSVALAGVSVCIHFRGGCVMVGFGKLDVRYQVSHA
jgi:hypothetical protein